MANHGPELKCGDCGCREFVGYNGPVIACENCGQLFDTRSFCVPAQPQESDERAENSPASPAQQLNCAIAFIAKVAHARELPGGGGGCQECNIDALVDEAQEFLATQQHN